MSEMKLMTLAAQQHYDEKIKGFIAEEDAKLLDKIETHVHSWNDLTDKPFGEEQDVLSKSFNTDEFEYVESKNVYRKISHTSMFFGIPIYNVNYESTIIYNGVSESVYYSGEHILWNQYSITACGNPYLVDSELEDNGLSYCFFDGYDIVGMDDYISGIYLKDYPTEITIISKGEKTIILLDEKYIPDTIARISDLENIDLTPYETKTDAAAKLEEAKAFASDEDAKVQGAVDILSGKVTTLVGEDTNKSVRTIANEELAKQLVAEGAKESLDTLTEIAAWIQSHPDDASAMNKAINDLEALVGALPDGVTATTIIGYIQEVVAANKALIDANTEAVGALHAVANSGSWNDLEDKPFGEEICNIDMLPECIIEDEYFSTMNYYFGSYPEKAFLKINDSVYEVALSEYDDMNGYPQHRYSAANVDASVTYDGSIGCVKVNVSYNMELPVKIALYYEGTGTKTLDSKYIGPDIARVTDQSVLEERVTVVESEIDTLAEVARTGSWNDLKDKPFSEVLEKTYIIEPTNPNVLGEWNIDFSVDMIPYYKVLDSIDNNPFEDGNEYIVEVDGMCFTIPYVSCLVDDIVYEWVGDNGGSDDSPCPSGYTFNYAFAFVNGELRFYSFMGPQTNESIQNVALYSVRNTIAYLDEKFIPDTIARISDFCEVANEEIDAMFA